MSLKQKTISALAWSACERFSQQGIQFIVTIILARLLTPAEFGLIGLLIIFMAIAQAFMESGFGAALIQKQDASFTDECSIFYFNIIIGFFAAGILCLCAPLIAQFYGQPQLISLTRVMSLNLIFNAFGLIQTTLLNKNINFKVMFKVSLLATIISGIVGISMAYEGFGVWSLVGQSLSRAFSNTLLLWVATKWRPAFIFSYKSLRQMFGFGSKLLFSGVLNTVFNNIYLVVIGRFFPAASLGYYMQAKQMQNLPVTNICTIVDRVTFPVFSTIQTDKELLKSSIRKVLTTLVMVVFPMMVGLAVVSRSLIVALFTEKWLPCVPYLQLLCVIGAFLPLHVINLNVLKALGRSDLFFRLEIIKKIIIIISISITFRWGIESLLYGQIITSFIGYLLNSYYTKKLIDYSLASQARDFFPYLVVSFLTGIFVYYFDRFVPIRGSYLLASQISIGVLFYFVLCNFFKLRQFLEAKLLVLEKVGFKC